MADDGGWSGLQLRFASGGMADSDRLGPSDRYRPFQEILIPVVEYARLSAAELAVLEHPAVQRLRWIEQLGLTSLVFPGGTHTRLEHCLGVLAITQTMVDEVNKSLEEGPGKPVGDWVLDDPLRPSEVAFVRLAALLHDIGHIPMGHTLEDEVGLLPRHDSNDRIDQVLDRESWLGIKGRPLRNIIDQQYGPAAAELGFLGKPSALLVELITKGEPGYELRRESSHPEIRVGVLRRMVSDTVCADLLDYIHRDRVHIGVTKHFSTRLLHHLEIRRPFLSKSGSESRLVLNLFKNGRRRSDAVTEVLGVLADRHELFEMAFFHRTKITATAMLERALSEARSFHRDLGREEEDRWLELLTDWLLDSTDAELLLVGSPHARGSVGQQILPRELPPGVRVLPQNIRQRRLHKCFIEYMGPQFPPSVRGRVEQRYGGPDRWWERLQLARGLEASLGLEAGSVVVYCPGQPPAKIAQVDVLVDDQVRSLARHEELVSIGRSNTDLTVGILAAQRARTAALWRVEIAVEKGQLERLGSSEGVLEELARVALGYDDGPRNPVDKAVDLAYLAARTARFSPLYGRESEIDSSLAGQRRGGLSDGFFPGGMPWLTTLLP